MQNILTAAFEARRANIAKNIGYMKPNPDLVYELIKGAAPAQKRKVKKVMDEWKAGTLRSGSKQGPRVKDYHQALAIAMSEAKLAKGDVDVYYNGKLDVEGTEISKGGKKKLKKEMSGNGGEPDGGSFAMGDAGSGEDDIALGFDYDDGEPSGYEEGDPDTDEDRAMHADDYREVGKKGKVEKGLKGEGSKGGHIVGHTKSGKPIYDTSSKEKFKTSLEKIHGKVKESGRSGGVHRGISDFHNEKKEKVGQYDPKGEHTYAKHESGMQKIEHPEKLKEHLEKYHEEDPEKFFEVVGKHYEPEDDGESESKMFENLAKHPKLEKIVSQLHKKFKKAEDDELEKAVENLLGIQDPLEKAFNDIMVKGGPGSNKAGRCIGTTRSGKNVHVFKEANDYGDFEPVDHLEAHKIHLHHAAKVTGVAAVNSRIRAHDHEDLARIKAAKKEAEENEKTNQKAEKAKQIKAGAKAKPKGKVEKALADFLNKDEVNKAFSDVLEKGEIASTMSTYNDKQPISFSKTGKEIAAKLLAQSVLLAGQEASIGDEMDTLEEAIGEAPDDVNTSYNVKTLSAPRYTYDFYTVKCEAPAGGGWSYATEDTYTDDEKARRANCQKYNDLSYRLLGVMEDLNAIRIITENIEPTKKYPLSVGQLTSLGF